MKQYKVREYAEGELTRLWAAAGGPAYEFELCVCGELPENAYGYERRGACVRILGQSERELVPAVFSFLSATGFVFDTQTHIPRGDRFTPDAVRGRQIIRPRVGLRGIRQHINFPMDISSYSLPEACEYIRMLARLGMNAITFHSYEGQWHREPGNFFYGNPHRVDERPDLAAAIRNEKYYIIPECEPYFDDRAARGRFAVQWLNAVMDQAKTCGMHVTLSLEPAEDVAVTREALALYPNIDMLELITPEGGGTAPESILDAAGLAQKARTLFGDGALNAEGGLDGLYDKAEHSPRIYPTMLSLRRAMDQLPHLTDIPVRVGLYVTEPETLCVIKNIMDRVLPRDMIFTFLAAHGTDAVLSNLSQAAMLQPRDLARTVVHAWAEFDGNMYLLQNAANAEARLLSWLSDFADAEQLHAVYFNHWRTAENTLAIAAAGALTVKPADICDFYRDYARRTGLPDGDAFADAAYRLGELDVYCRNNLFNIGFCYRNCWTRAGLGWMRYKTCDKIEVALAEYGELQKTLAALRDGAEGCASDAAPLLTLLENRCRVSISHLRMTHAVRKIEEDTPVDVIRECLDRAAAHGEDYIRQHLEMMPDRACEGQIASFVYCMLGYLDSLRETYLAGLEVETPDDTAAIDAPAVVDAPASQG